jgi:succinate dehydrogenase/fumarate reductase flavoprotein subunit
MEKDIIPNLATQCKIKTYNREWQQTIEDRNMVTILKMIARASLMRDESRGSLYRMDYPEKDNDRWLKNIVLSKRKEEMALVAKDVELTKSQPKRRGRMRYGIKT